MANGLFTIGRPTQWPMAYVIIYCKCVICTFPLNVVFVWWWLGGGGAALWSRAALFAFLNRIENLQAILAAITNKFDCFQQFYFAQNSSRLTTNGF